MVFEVLLKKSRILVATGAIALFVTCILIYLNQYRRELLLNGYEDDRVCLSSLKLDKVQRDVDRSIERGDTRLFGEFTGGENVGMHFEGLANCVPYDQRVEKIQTRPDLIASILKRMNKRDIDNKCSEALYRYKVRFNSEMVLRYPDNMTAHCTNNSNIVDLGNDFKLYRPSAALVRSTEIGNRALIRRSAHGR